MCIDGTKQRLLRPDEEVGFFGYASAEVERGSLLGQRAERLAKHGMIEHGRTEQQGEIGARGSDCHAVGLGRKEDALDGIQFLCVAGGDRGEVVGLQPGRGGAIRRAHPLRCGARSQQLAQEKCGEREGSSDGHGLETAFAARGGIL